MKKVKEKRAVREWKDSREGQKGMEKRKKVVNRECFCMCMLSYMSVSAQLFVCLFVCLSVCLCVRVCVMGGEVCDTVRRNCMTTVWFSSCRLHIGWKGLMTTREKKKTIEKKCVLKSLLLALLSRHWYDYWKKMSKAIIIQLCNEHYQSFCYSCCFCCCRSI